MCVNDVVLTRFSKIAQDGPGVGTNESRLTVSSSFYIQCLTDVVVTTVTYSVYWHSTSCVGISCWRMQCPWWVVKTLDRQHRLSVHMSFLRLKEYGQSDAMKIFIELIQSTCIWYTLLQLIKVTPVVYGIYIRDAPGPRIKRSISSRQTRSVYLKEIRTFMRWGLSIEPMIFWLYSVLEEQGSTKSCLTPMHVYGLQTIYIYWPNMITIQQEYNCSIC